jgi:hypothetical protein
MVATVIGLMGFGWGVAKRDRWLVPTMFFGVLSFGCALGGTTAITFVVDSYRQYAEEAFVTLNFFKSKLSSSTLSRTFLRALLTWGYRHSSRLGILPFLQPLARSRWLEECLCDYWVCTHCLSSYNDPNVRLWKERADVDCEEKVDGQVLGHLFDILKHS